MFDVITDTALSAQGAIGYFRQGTTTALNYFTGLLIHFRNLGDYVISNIVENNFRATDAVVNLMATLEILILNFSASTKSLTTNFDTVVSNLKQDFDLLKIGLQKRSGSWLEIFIQNSKFFYEIWYSKLSKNLLSILVGILCSLVAFPLIWHHLYSILVLGASGSILYVISHSSKEKEFEVTELPVYDDETFKLSIIKEIQFDPSKLRDCQTEDDFVDALMAGPENVCNYETLKSIIKASNCKDLTIFPISFIGSQSYNNKFVPANGTLCPVIGTKVKSGEYLTYVIPFALSPVDPLPENYIDLLSSNQHYQSFSDYQKETLISKLKEKANTFIIKVSAVFLYHSHSTLIRTFSDNDKTTLKCMSKMLQILNANFKEKMHDKLIIQYLDQDEIKNTEVLKDYMKSITDHGTIMGRNDHDEVMPALASKAQKEGVGLYTFLGEVKKALEILYGNSTVSSDYIAQLKDGVTQYFSKDLDPELGLNQTDIEYRKKYASNYLNGFNIGKQKEQLLDYLDTLASSYQVCNKAGYCGHQNNACRLKSDHEGDCNCSILLIVKVHSNAQLAVIKRVANFIHAFIQKILIPRQMFMIVRQRFTKTVLNVDRDQKKFQTVIRIYMIVGAVVLNVLSIFENVNLEPIKNITFTDVINVVKRTVHVITQALEHVFCPTKSAIPFINVRIVVETIAEDRCVRKLVEEESNIPMLAHVWTKRCLFV